MKPEIVHLSLKNLIGKSVKMSVSNNKTAELWKSVMPLIHQIEGRITIDKISLQNYSPGYFIRFDPGKEFEKWAAVEVAPNCTVPKGFKSMQIPAGKYAVFHYKGLSNDPKIFQSIFTQWLPQSPYDIADRPHFEILGSNYRNNDVNSEETIWIPIKKKEKPAERFIDLTM